MQTQKPTQLSLYDFNFCEPDLEDSIDNLFTENDMIRFGKGRKGWQENDIMSLMVFYFSIDFGNKPISLH
ncbi:MULTISPECIES: hypothetical protein [Bacillaceae]|uniref:Transposase n=1 Tax=Evansella alkalicola TaxID=745819 RepID=A0ABS6JXC4_9BACI|nr:MULTISPECIES: hypothetical protein [Bacillaceae]MBU9723242.1 hypothetical protein [Bacillus alkalicola]